MIKVTGKRAVRNCTATYITEEGETAEIAVEYYSWTIAEMKATRKEAELRVESAPGNIVWASELLADRLHALPDLADDKGKPFKITVANLDKLDIDNLNAIREAIDEDISAGKSRPAK
jgi:hypothetical protein